MDEASCREYLEQRLGPAVQGIANLPFAMQGRPQFSVQFTKMALQHPASSLETMLERCTHSWTEKGSRSTQSSDSKRLYSTIAQAASFLADCGPDGHAVVDLLKATTLRYSLTGQPQDVMMAAENSLQHDGVVSLMEQGVCQLKKARTEDRLQVLVDEPLVARACCNFFNLQTFEWGLMRQLKDSASSLG